MMWLLLPLAAALFLSLMQFTENFIIDTWSKKLRPQNLKVSYLVFNAFGLLIFLALKGNEIFSQDFSPLVIWSIIGAGAVGSLAGIPYYAAFKKGDTTEITLFAQVTPIISLIMGVIFLGQIPDVYQGIAFFLIMAAVATVVVGAGKRKIRAELGVGLTMLAYCTLVVVSNVIFVSESSGVDSWLTYFFFVVLGNFVGNTVLVLVMKSWRADAKQFWHGKKSQKFIALLGASLLWWLSELTMRVGILILPLAIMAVTSTVLQLIITFILGIVLTLMWPKFGREKLTRKTIINHAIATCIAAIAIILLR